MRLQPLGRQGPPEGIGGVEDIAILQVIQGSKRELINAIEELDSN